MCEKSQGKVRVFMCAWMQMISVRQPEQKDGGTTETSNAHRLHVGLKELDDARLLLLL